MKKRMLFIFLVVIPSLISCSSLKEHISSVNQKKITTETLKSIEGKYSIITKNSDYLPGVLINNYYFNNNNLPDENDYVELVFLKGNRFEINIIDNEIIVKRKKIRGKLKDGYFEFSTTQLSPFWIILTAIHHNKIRFFINEQGNMGIDYSESHLGLFIIMPFLGSKKEKENIETQRIRIADKGYNQ